MLATTLAADAPQPVHYLPILTTVISAAFQTVLLRRASKRNWAPHLMWWAAGVFAYGVGTAIESSVTLFGNSVALFTAWYIAGAVFGGYPLAQGSVYLHFPRRTAHILGALSLTFALALSVLIVLSPKDASLLQPHRPDGAVLVWQWVRLGTPIINLYAVIFLIGTAFWSAMVFAWVRRNPGRAIGNTFIAVGAILPGVGGGMAKAGHVEWLYVGELTGIILIWIGYAFCVRAPSPRKIPVGASAPEGAVSPSG
jgi:hypothetical protein